MKSCNESQNKFKGITMLKTCWGEKAPDLMHLLGIYRCYIKLEKLLQKKLFSLSFSFILKYKNKQISQSQTHGTFALEKK